MCTVDSNDFSTGPRIGDGPTSNARPSGAPELNVDLNGVDDSARRGGRRKYQDLF
jgi:hypothetical protein